VTHGVTSDFLTANLVNVWLLKSVDFLLKTGVVLDGSSNCSTK
jgi:hypothetical protein